MALFLFGLRPNGRDRHTHVPHVTIESRVFHFKISMDAVRALSPCVTCCDDKSIKPAFGIVIRSGAVFFFFGVARKLGHMLETYVGVSI